MQVIWWRPSTEQRLRSKRWCGLRGQLCADTRIEAQGGGNSTMNQDAYSDLATNGVDVRWAWSGTLWHQKSISRDGAAAAIMTCNLYAPYYPTLRDFAVITNNRATVAGMEATFDKDRQATSSPPTSGVVPSGSDLVWSPGAQTPLVDLIDSARPGTTIWAEDEQLDSQPIQQALVSTAKRGVTVTPSGDALGTRQTQLLGLPLRPFGLSHCDSNSAWVGGAEGQTRRVKKSARQISR